MFSSSTTIKSSSHNILLQILQIFIMRKPSITFPQFPQLPPELRLCIYKLATPPPRIIELAWSSKARTLVSLTPPPPLLQTCHESRHYHISRYKSMVFGYSSQIILVNFDQDTIFFGPGCRHLVPSGRSNPWVKQNPRVIWDIVSSLVLGENLSLAVFDQCFAAGIEQLETLCNTLKRLETVKIVGPLGRGEMTAEEKRVKEPLRFVRSRVVEWAERDESTAWFLAYASSRKEDRKISVESGRVARNVL
ncbi:uncharacterized protein LY89DRAFT_715269 [Mollisia scopiformis]|uniref:2EXR domain-containing protein n=1 Tax=Mollisia scopiformis TaxID=149040 RepID=A0A194XLL0_MOLSC|nr:uncharacterized protein LY89DRAFT_715269 [Mollisia scopiformis]KUJ20969.1 hypothetical protein LY89DRAFT_715269 [Mollisia scopiformis]